MFLLILLHIFVYGILHVVHYSGRQVGFFHKRRKDTSIMEDINIKQLTLAVRTIAEEKNLPEETVLSVIEQAIAAAWRRDNGSQDERSDHHGQSQSTADLRSHIHEHA